MFKKLLTLSSCTSYVTIYMDLYVLFCRMLVDFHTLFNDTCSKTARQKAK